MNTKIKIERRYRLKECAKILGIAYSTFIKNKNDGFYGNIPVIAVSPRINLITESTLLKLLKGEKFV